MKAITTILIMFVFCQFCYSDEYDYHVFVREGDHIQHYRHSLKDGKWHKGKRIGSNVKSAPAVFQNMNPEPGAIYNYELFVREGDHITHYYYRRENDVWHIDDKTIGSNVQSAPAVFQNMAPEAKYNYELFVREGDQIRHHYYRWENDLWHIDNKTIGSNVQSAPAVFQNRNADPDYQYNYEVFVSEGDSIQHYSYKWATGEWKNVGKIVPNAQSAPAVFQNMDPGTNMYNYELFVRDKNDHINRYCYVLNSNNWLSAKTVSSSIQSAPAVFQNMNPIYEFRYEMFVLQGNAIHNYCYNIKKDEWFKSDYKIVTETKLAPAAFYDQRIITSKVQNRANITINDFNLYQNRPNPYNPSTKIQFSLKNRKFVRLTVYNIRGQMIEELINKEMAKGYHTITFNGAHLPSGVYHYKLETDNFQQTKKMLLIK